MLGKALDNLVELISSINGEIKELRSQLSERSHSGEAPTGNKQSAPCKCMHGVYRDDCRICSNK